MRILIFTLFLIILHGCIAKEKMFDKKIERVYENEFNNRIQKLILFKDSTYFFSWRSKSMHLLEREGFGRWHTDKDILVLNSNRNNKIDSIKFSDSNLCEEIRSLKQIDETEREELLNDCDEKVKIRFFDRDENQMYIMSKIFNEEDNQIGKVQFYTKLDTIDVEHENDFEVAGYIRKRDLPKIKISFDSWRAPLKIVLDSISGNNINIYGNFALFSEPILINEQWRMKESSITGNKKLGNFFQK